MNARTRTWMRLVTVALVGLAGCGGGGGDGDGGVTQVSVVATAALDGYVSKNYPILNSGYSATNEIIVGDVDCLEPDWYVHGMISFDLPFLPPGATIQSAVMQVWQRAVQAAPYSTLGSVVADHVDYGATLDANDPTTVYDSNIGTLSADTAIEYKTLDVTAQVLADLALGRTRTQYRLRFSAFPSDNDVYCDQVHFGDAENTQGHDHLPMLTITYAD